MNMLLGSLDCTLCHRASSACEYGLLLCELSERFSTFSNIFDWKRGGADNILDPFSRLDLHDSRGIEPRTAERENSVTLCKVLH